MVMGHRRLTRTASRARRHPEQWRELTRSNRDDLVERQDKDFWPNSFRSARLTSLLSVSAIALALAGCGTDAPGSGAAPASASTPATWA